VAARQSLPSFTVPLASALSEAVAITSREDLIPPAVAIAYQKPWSTGERCGMSTVVDYAPVVPGETDEERAARLSQSDVLWATYDLAGMQAMYVEKSQSLETEPINWNANKSSASWWARWCPQLNDPNISDVGIMNPATDATLPNLLLAGAVQEWMDVEESEETFTCEAQIITGPLILPNEIRVEKLVVKLKTTDGLTKTYKKKELASYDSGESIPSGLAALLMAEWQQLHYDGEITLAAHDAPMGAGPGMTLNITGGRTEWAAMQAMIVSVAQDLGNGRTTIRFGVPQWIDLDSRVAFYRSCRSRRYTMTRNLSEPQDQGEVEQTDEGAAGIVGLPGSRDGGNIMHHIRKVFFNPAATVPHSVEIDLTGGLRGITFADQNDASTARDIRIKEVLLPVDGLGSGTVSGFKKAQIIACEPYGDEIPLGPESSSPHWGDTTIPEAPEDPGGIEIIEGDITIDLNAAAVHNAPVRLSTVLPGVTPTLFPAQFISARFTAQGSEGSSLGIVRGENSGSRALEVRLAGVDAPPAHSDANRVYGFGSDDAWNLLELEPVIVIDSPNKKLRFAPDAMNPATGSSQKDLTNSSNQSGWIFANDSPTYNSVKLRVLVDLVFNSTTLKLDKIYRDITLPKQFISAVSAPTRVTVMTGQEC
jgi:hypothetical protein